jgi:hypothetical protein
MVTRIHNGIEYQIPPGTEDRWTPPDQVVVTPPRDDVPALNAISGLKVQGLVRNQDNDKVVNLSIELENIWQDFLDKKTTKDQLTEQLANFRNVTLTNIEGVDDITIQAFETVIIKIMTESNK